MYKLVTLGLDPLVQIVGGEVPIDWVQIGDPLVGSIGDPWVEVLGW